MRLNRISLQSVWQSWSISINAAREKSSNTDSFLRLVKNYIDIKELNAEIIRTFIEKVYVYGNEKPWDRNTKKIKVIFNFI